jgi:hypothetical protein
LSGTVIKILFEEEFDMKTGKMTIGALCLSLTIAAGVFAIDVSAITDKKLNESQFKGVKITAQNFPDSEVRRSLARIDKDNDGVLSQYEQENINNYEWNSNGSFENDFYSYCYLCITTTKNAIDLRGLSKLKYVTRLELRTDKERKLKVKNFSEVNKMNVDGLVFTKCKINKLDISNAKKLNFIKVTCSSEAGFSTKISNLTINNNPELVQVSIIVDKVKIDNCKKLERLYFDSTKKVDLSKLTKLSALSIKGDNFDNINLTKNKELQMLDVCADNLKNIDLSKNAKLQSVSFDKCKKLEKIKLVNKKSLREVNVSGCKKLKEVDVEKNPDLEELTISEGSNKLSVVVKNNKNLYTLELKNVKYKKLDLSGNERLGVLNLENDGLKELKLGRLPALWYLKCNDNELKKLDLSGYNKLHVLICDNNKIKKLNLSKNKKVGSVSCKNNRISKLDCSKLSKLDELKCDGNNIEKLDLSNNSKIKYVSAESCGLKTIVFPYDAEMQDLNLKNNNIEQIDLSNILELPALNIYNNPIKILDVPLTLKISKISGNRDLQVTGQREIREFTLSREDGKTLYFDCE